MRKKHVLKEGFRALVPEGIVQRAEQIYGAPVSPCFVNPEAGRAHETLSTWSGACMRIFRSRRRGTIGPKLKKSGGASAGLARTCPRWTLFLCSYSPSVLDDRPDADPKPFGVHRWPVPEQGRAVVQAGMDDLCATGNVCQSPCACLEEARSETMRPRSLAV